jgi:hypothetical protein
MESVKSLEKANAYHKKEQKLLGEIQTELKDYWNLAQASDKIVTDDHQLVSAKMEQKVDVKAKAQDKPAPQVGKPSTLTQTDSSDPEVDENV